MKYSYLKSITIILLLLSEQRAACCINRYFIHIDGTYTYDYNDGGKYIWGHFNEYDGQNIANDLHNADSTYKATGRLEDYSDYGAMLIYNKEYLKAKGIFQEIEAKSPGLYATAANIGTIYELLGNNDSALYWIKRAIAINPNSHHGSEWIHVKILEAKINANGDDNYFANHKVLSLDFGNDEIPKYKQTNNIILDSLSNQLYYQLNERMTFIKPKDPIIGQLLFDFGNSDAYGIHVALSAYKKAKEYGYSSDLLDKRIAYLEKLEEKEDRRNAIDEFEHKHMSGILIALALLAISLVFFIPLAITKYITRKKD